MRLSFWLCRPLCFFFRMKDARRITAVDTKSSRLSIRYARTGEMFRRTIVDRPLGMCSFFRDRQGSERSPSFVFCARAMEGRVAAPHYVEEEQSRRSAVCCMAPIGCNPHTHSRLRRFNANCGNIDNRSVNGPYGANTNAHRYSASGDTRNYNRLLGPILPFAGVHQFEAQFQMARWGWTGQGPIPRSEFSELGRWYRRRAFLLGLVLVAWFFVIVSYWTFAIWLTS